MYYTQLYPGNEQTIHAIDLQSEKLSIILPSVVLIQNPTVTFGSVFYIKEISNSDLGIKKCLVLFWPGPLGILKFHSRCSWNLKMHRGPGQNNSRHFLMPRSSLDISWYSTRLRLVDIIKYSSRAYGPRRIFLILHTSPNPTVGFYIIVFLKNGILIYITRGP